MGGKRWAFWTFVVLLVLLHLVLHLGFGLGAEAPDLLTIAVLVIGRRVRGGGAALAGLLIGLLRDAVNTVTFGADAIVLTILGYVGARTRDFFVGDSVLFLTVYFFLGKWLHDIAYYVIAQRSPGYEPVEALLVAAPIAAIYASVVGLVAVGIYRLLAGTR